MTKLTGGLVVAVAVVVAMAGPVQAGEDRGWMFGGGVTGGHLGFTNTVGRGVAVGPVEDVTYYYGTRTEHRGIQVFDGNTPPPANADWTVPFPKSSGQPGVSMHFGWAFSPRVAVLIRVPW
jgi:hypothetical protein